MASPARERWAVATLEGVGARRELGSPDGGKWDVFDLDLRVIDGWNVAPGPVRAFWNEDNAHRRHALLSEMVGTRVLVRLAPVENGRFLIVSGLDEDPELTPTFAVGEKPLLSLLLPTAAASLEGSTPVEKRFYSLWRAAASLSPSAYPRFERYVGAAVPPVSSRLPKVQLLNDDKVNVGEARPAGSDVRWLRQLAAKTSPAFQMLVEENLRRNEIVGCTQNMRGIVKAALRDPSRFPDGVFVDVVNPSNLFEETWQDPQWPPVDSIVNCIVKRPSRRLTTDLLVLLTVPGVHVPTREKLLPLLTDSDPSVRNRAVAAFGKWHGKAPDGTDALAWHRARAKLGMKELEAAKAAPGG